MPFTAIIADLVASREATADQRTTQQRVIRSTLEELNQRLSDSLVRPMALTAGDEIQCLLNDPRPLVPVIQVLEDALAPHAVRRRSFAFGVGFGDLSTALDPEAPVEHLDGPCFHSARAALAHAAGRKIWAAFEGFEPATTLALNSIFELMGALRGEWTDTQAEHTIELRRLGVRIEVARARGVSPSVVTESLQAAHFDAIERAEKAAVKILGLHGRHQS